MWKCLFYLFSIFFNGLWVWWGSCSAYWHFFYSLFNTRSIDCKYSVKNQMRCFRKVYLRGNRCFQSVVASLWKWVEGVSRVGGGGSSCGVCQLRDEPHELCALHPLRLIPSSPRVQLSTSPWWNPPKRRMVCMFHTFLSVVFSFDIHAQTLDPGGSVLRSLSGHVKLTFQVHNAKRLTLKNTFCPFTFVVVSYQDRNRKGKWMDTLFFFF